jgi:heme-degrading monooxygenase HmoA
MMYARATFVNIQTGKNEEVRKILRESVIPAAKEQKGFRAIYLLQSEDDPTMGLALSMWDSKAEADAGEQSGYYQEQVQKFAPLFAAPPERKGYEVTVSSEE